PGEGLLMSITSPDGKMLAVGASNKVRLREVDSTQERPIALPDGFTVGSLAISPDGTKLAVGSSTFDSKPTIQIYDTKTLRPLGSFREGAESANKIVFAPDSKHLIVGGGKGSVSIWDVDSPTNPEILPANGTVFVDVSRDGKMIAASSMNTDTKTFPVLLW